MPGRDGTGPLGQGAFTGRGAGLCQGGTGQRLGGQGRGMGFGARCGLGRRGKGRGMNISRGSEKSFLEREKADLQMRLKDVSNDLENLNEE